MMSGGLAVELDERPRGVRGGYLVVYLVAKVGSDTEDNGADIGENCGIVGGDGAASSFALEPGFILNDFGDEGELAL